MSFAHFNFTLGGDPLDLDKIRGVLTRLEDTIIFQLIERAQFAHNPKLYHKGEFQELKDLGFEGSLLDWFLKETESFHGASSFIPGQLRSKRLIHVLTRCFQSAKARRYTRYANSCSYSDHSKTCLITSHDPCPI